MTTPTRFLQAAMRSPTLAGGVTTPPCCRRGRGRIKSGGADSQPRWKNRTQSARSVIEWGQDKISLTSAALGTLRHDHCPAKAILK